MVLKLVLLLDVLLCFMDGIVISSLRRFLLDFLIGARNPKSARKLHAQQSDTDRLTMAYIPALLKRYQAEARRYQRLYMAVLISLMPQYLIVIVTNLLIPKVSLFITGGFALVKLAIELLISFQTDSLHRSVYRGNK